MFRPKARMFFILVVALTTIGPLIAAQGVSSEDLLSPRLIALQIELRATNQSAVENFWQDIAKHGTPLVEPIPGDHKHVLVTFLLRASEEVKNVVLFSTLMAASSNDPADHQLARLPDTDLWYKTYIVWSDARFAYSFSPNDPLIPRESRLIDFQADPLNPHRVIARDDGAPNSQEKIVSVVELAASPPQPWIQQRPGVPAGELKLHQFRSEILRNERRVWIYAPPGYEAKRRPYHLLILFDGGDYTSSIPTPIILYNLLANGLLPPFVAVFVDALNNDTRTLELGCYPLFNDFLAQELVPWVRRHYHVTSNPAQTIVGGFSRGGLAAAFAGLQHPEIFGNILSQSGAFGWKDRWLIRQYAASPKLPLRFYLDIGLLERRGLLESNSHIRDVLQAKGYSVHYKEFTGGHESLSWRGTLADGLLALFGKATNKK